MVRNGDSNAQVCGLEECKKLIPPFNPSSAGGMSAKDWIKNIETVKNMFKWNDSSTLFYGALRLEEAASSWFTATRHDQLTWDEFKASLLQAFPTDADNGQLYVKLMQRTKKKDESIEKYFYDVLALARQGGFDDEAAKNFIVSGLDDKELAAAVTSAINKTEPVHGLLAQIKVHLNILDQQRTRAKFTHQGNNVEAHVSTKHFKPYMHRQSANKRVDSRTCFKCREVGHIARDCRKQNYFRNNNYHDEPRAKMAKLSTKNNGFNTCVSIEGNDVDAFLDLGSECSTIKIMKVNDYNWKFEKSSMKLVGFGGSVVSAMGKINKTVSVQNVSLPIDIFVVNNKDQESDMIVGQNFLDSPGVRCVRENGNFTVSLNQTTTK